MMPETVAEADRLYEDARCVEDFGDARDAARLFRSAALHYRAAAVEHPEYDCAARVSIKHAQRLESEEDISGRWDVALTLLVLVALGLYIGAWHTRGFSIQGFSGVVKLFGEIK